MSSWWRKRRRIPTRNLSRWRRRRRRGKSRGGRRGGRGRGGRRSPPITKRPRPIGAGFLVYLRVILEIGAYLCAASSHARHGALSRALSAPPTSLTAPCSTKRLSSLLDSPSDESASLSKLPFSTCTSGISVGTSPLLKVLQKFSSAFLASSAP
jgi:hypothetical protein